MRFAKVHAGAMGSVVGVADYMMPFVRRPRTIDKSKRCANCKDNGCKRCRGTRLCIDRRHRPCECPCRLDLLDPDL